jgi:hypothetical protein
MFTLGFLADPALTTLRLYPHNPVLYPLADFATHAVAMTEDAAETGSYQGDIDEAKEDTWLVFDVAVGVPTRFDTALASWYLPDLMKTTESRPHTR